MKLKNKNLPFETEFWISKTYTVLFLYLSKSCVSKVLHVKNLKYV